MRICIVGRGPQRVVVDVAERPLERMRGLIGKTADRGLLLPRTRSVHTFGMRVAIDAVLLDRDARVVDVVRLVPRRVLLPRRRVRAVVELARSPFGPGDVLRLEQVDRAGQPPSPADPVTTH